MGSEDNRVTERRVIRAPGQRESRRAMFVRIAAAGSGLALLFLVYEFGQMRAGHNRLDAAQRYGELKGEFVALQEVNQELREKIAILETNEKVKAEAYRNVEGQLVELQAKILEQTEDLAFYRGIVSSDQQSGLRIQDFELSVAADKDTYVLRMVLAQAIRNDRRVSGRVDLAVEGKRDGETVTLDFKDLFTDPQGGSSLNFSFRYFQNLQANLVLPDGFDPDRVIIKLKPKSKSIKVIEKTYEWTAQSG